MARRRPDSASRHSKTSACFVLHSRPVGNEERQAGKNGRCANLNLRRPLLSHSVRCLDSLGWESVISAYCPRSGAISRARRRVGGLGWLLGLIGPGHWSLGSTLGGSTMDIPLSTSTALDTRYELFSPNEQLALAGFLAGYSGLTRDAYTLDLRPVRRLVHRTPGAGVRGASRRCRVLRPPPRVPGPGPGHHRPPAVHRHVLLPLRRTGRPHRRFPAAHLRRPRLDTSPTPPASTATRSAPCWSPQG